MTATEKYAELKQKLAALREAAKTAAKEFMAEGSRELFCAHPGLESYSWTQYTPYFNDGDACEFRAHIDEPGINGKDGYDLPEELEPIQQAVVEFLRAFEDDDLEDMFGDHCKVTVTRNGADIESYDHD